MGHGVTGETGETREKSWRLEERFARGWRSEVGRYSIAHIRFRIAPARLG